MTSRASGTARDTTRQGTSMSRDINAMRELRSEVQAMVRAQGQAGGQADEEMLDAFAQRVAVIIEGRMQELQVDRKVRDQDRRDRSQIRMIAALASLIITVPTTAILWHTDGPIASMAIWVAVLLLNVVAMMRAPVRVA
jgi:hypothetical protein